VWAEVDLDRPNEKWSFHCIPTGISLEDQNGNYMLNKYTFYGTVSLFDGGLIFHVYGRNYEEKKQPIEPKKVAENKSYTTKNQSKINLSLLGF
jgi:hypothetical protein